MKCSKCKKNYKDTMPTCPKCGEKANVTKGGKILKGGIGAYLGFSAISSLFTTAPIIALFFKVITFGLVGSISIMLLPMIMAFLIIFLPIYGIIQVVVGYDVDCPHCKSKFKLSNKAYFEIKDKERAEIKDK